MIYRRKLEKMIFMSILVTLSIILGIIDSAYLGFLTWTPSTKIGLANIVIIVSIYYFSFREVLFIASLKSIVIGLLLGTPMTFLIGLSGTMLSFIVMYILLKIGKDKFSLIGISISGSVFHTIGQFLVVVFLYSTGILALIPLNLVISIVTGIGIGMITDSLIKYLNSNSVFDPIIKKGK